MRVDYILLVHVTKSISWPRNSLLHSLSPLLGSLILCWYIIARHCNSILWHCVSSTADNVPSYLHNVAPSSPIPLVQPSGNHCGALGKTPGGVFQTWSLTDRLEFVQWAEIIIDEKYPCMKDMIIDCDNVSNACPSKQWRGTAKVHIIYNIIL